MKTLCEICFDNDSSNVFYAGQLFSGCVKLKLFKEKTFKAIYVKIIGRAYWMWHVGKRRLTDEEYYLNEKIFFVGDVVLQPGEYNYTFSCMLPADLPSSVEGKTGFVQYIVKVYFERPIWSDKKFKRIFTVHKMVNLNDYVAYQLPVVKEERRRFFYCCLLCCRTEPLLINARIPFAGYIPGQTIELSLEINNRSDESFGSFKIQFIKLIQYYYISDKTLRCCHDKEVLEQINCDGCQRNRIRKYKINMTVPLVSPTDESVNSIVKVRYFLRIRGTTYYCRKDPILDIPIIIGTHPISDLIGKSTITQQLAPNSLCQSNSDDVPTMNQPHLPAFSFNLEANTQPYLSSQICSSVARGTQPIVMCELIGSTTITQQLAPASLCQSNSDVVPTINKPHLPAFSSNGTPNTQPYLGSQTCDSIARGYSICQLRGFR